MKKVFLIVLFIFNLNLMFSQSDEVVELVPKETTKRLSLALDIVYPYLWRGLQYNGEKIAFQPSLSYNLTDRLSIGIWGTTNFSNASDAYNEFDWSVSYQFSPSFSILLEDYYWPATRNNTDWEKRNYFDYSEGSAQSIDLSVIVDLSENGIPIDFQWSTLIGGNDYKYDINQNRKRAFSSYAEIGYTYTQEKLGLDFRPFLGAAIINGGYYGVDANGNAGFTWTNVGFNVAKEIMITEKYNIPVFIRYSYNEYGVQQFDQFDQIAKTKRNFISSGITFNLE